MNTFIYKCISGNYILPHCKPDTVTQIPLKVLFSTHKPLKAFVEDRLNLGFANINGFHYPRLALDCTYKYTGPDYTWIWTLLLVEKWVQFVSNK